jgi:hypothetical protein
MTAPRGRSGLIIIAWAVWLPLGLCLLGALLWAFFGGVEVFTGTEG